MIYIRFWRICRILKTFFFFGFSEQIISGKLYHSPTTASDSLNWIDIFWLWLWTSTVLGSRCFCSGLVLVYIALSFSRLYVIRKIRYFSRIQSIKYSAFLWQWNAGHVMGKHAALERLEVTRLWRSFFLLRLFYGDIIYIH